jgi:D-alanyl-D-alanine carboxypeptidase
VLNLTPYSTTDFRFEPAGIKMLFAIKGENLDCTTFELKQGGGRYTFIGE